MPKNFDAAVCHWTDIPGWFQWREAQQEAVAAFDDGAVFVEVGCYLGRSLCSLAEVVDESRRAIAVVGVDTGRGSGAEGPSNIDAHGAAVRHGDGTFVGLLHRNVIACGFADTVQLLISTSTAAAALFADASLSWVHLDARHEYDSVTADIAAWAPKVAAGGWLSGDDYDQYSWPDVVRAVSDSLPGAAAWWSTQWRWIKPGQYLPNTSTTF